MYDTYPQHLQNIQEFKAISKATDYQINKLNDRLDEMRDNLLISTSRESGIAYREKILGIVPGEMDTLEERRYRVLLQWYDSYPYTEIDIRRRLNRICGAEEYVLNIDKMKNTLECLVELTSSKMLDSVKKMLERIVSLNVSIEVGLRYNQFESLRGRTWQEVSTHTWEEKKNEVMK